jgi:type III restriction enzyme
MDEEVISADVQVKREAAKRWANQVSADSNVGTHWCYLLVSRTEVDDANGSWEALKRLST